MLTFHAAWQIDRNFFSLFAPASSIYISYNGVYAILEDEHY